MDAAWRFFVDVWWGFWGCLGAFWGGSWDHVAVLGSSWERLGSVLVLDFSSTCVYVFPLKRIIANMLHERVAILFCVDVFF